MFILENKNGRLCLDFFKEILVTQFNLNLVQSGFVVCKFLTDGAFFDREYNRSIWLSERQPD